MSTHYESISYNKDLEGYIFANDNNIVYFVYFREDLSFEDSFVLKNKVLFTGFHTIPENAESVYDSKTYHTISHIILRNIRLNPEVAVTYICDLKDGRQAARNRLFNMWFKEHDEGDIVKVNKSIGDEFFSGLLIHYENPHFKDIVYKYEEVLDGLANK